MTHEPVAPNADAAAVPSAGPVHAEDAPAATSPSSLVVEILNLNRGQLIEMHVVGPWDAAELEARVLRVVSVRQPAELHLRLDLDDGDRVPSLQRARAALESFGGTLTVDASGPVAGGPPSRSDAS